MNKRLLSLLAGLTLAAFPELARSGDARLNVVATTADLGALAREIGGERVDVTVLAKPTEDAHFVDAKPSYMVRLARADVLIEGGAELETGWLPPLLDGSRNARIALGRPGHIRCAEGLALLEVPSTLDRSQGDIHALGNPHFMTDPVNARAVAGRIVEALATIDPEHAAAYRKNGDAFRTKLDEKLAAWQKQLAPFQGRALVAYHNSWPYFARRFGLKLDLFLEPKPGIPPTPANLAEVVTRMKAEKIGVIVVEPHQNRKTAEKVAAETGAVIVEFAQFPGGLKGTEAGYLELIDRLVTSLTEALKRGTPTPEARP